MKRKAFVEVVYSNAGPAMAGYNYGETIQSAEIVEVEAIDEIAAEDVARKESEEDEYITVHQATFKRWI